MEEIPHVILSSMDLYYQAAVHKESGRQGIQIFVACLTVMDTRVLSRPVGRQMPEVRTIATVHRDFKLGTDAWNTASSNKSHKNEMGLQQS